MPKVKHLPLMIVIVIATVVLITLSMRFYLSVIESPYAPEYLDTLESIAKYVFGTSTVISITLS